jgi:hypothetical protein
METLIKGMALDNVPTAFGLFLMVFRNFWMSLSSEIWSFVFAVALLFILAGIVSTILAAKTIITYVRIKHVIRNMKKKRYVALKRSHNKWEIIFD